MTEAQAEAMRAVEMGVEAGDGPVPDAAVTRALDGHRRTVSAFNLYVRKLEREVTGLWLAVLALGLMLAVSVVFLLRVVLVP